MDNGKLTLETLAAAVRAETIATVVVGFTDMYGRLMGKRFDADCFIETVANSGTHACNYLLTTDMEMNPVAGYAFANWGLGYGDFHLVPDLRTLRRADWLDKTALVLCDVQDEKTHERVAVAPRSVLRQQVEVAAAAGFQALAASELEYYLFENSYRTAAKKGYQNLAATGDYIEDYNILQGTRTEHFTAAARQHLKKSGVPVENSKGEWGLGQHELNVRYAEVLEMADRHVIFKQCLKELADSKGLSLTFMAKYDEKQAGSSCHLHLNLTQNSENAFCGTEDFGEFQASDIFRWFLGGWIAHTPEVMPFYAPTVNAYKRYVEASWAPTRLAWSFDNRTAGFRIVGKGAALRIECRIAGADCNPYLAFAAALASGLDGIAQRIEPPKMSEGNAYLAQNFAEVPKSLPEATAIFKNSAFAKRVFGEKVVAHYAHFFEEEQKAYQTAVTDWERKRYFEQI
jgi:glutamine synthetase